MTDNALAVTIRPPLGERANAVTARSISPALAQLIGLSSTPNDGATAWIAANWPIPADAGSRSTPSARHPGATSLSSSSHFALKPYSNRKAGGVAAGPRQALDEAGADRIDACGENDRHGAGRL